MSRKPTPATASDDQVQALLRRYRCPVPFHAVRTRFLGNIASPDLQASPIAAVKALWGGELPAFDTLDAGNELIGALVMGLWNRLTRHQERAAPFRLTRIAVPATRTGMGKFALLRREELDGFVDGLFGGKESLDLPERAHRALGTLAEIRAMLEASRELADDPTKPAEPADIALTLGHFRELTRIAEHEMHAAVLSCTRVRRQMIEALPTTKPVLH
jgi:acyl-CoA synthetase (NDP forming)